MALIRALLFMDLKLSQEVPSCLCMVHSAAAKKAGLLRRFAPRNDGVKPALLSNPIPQHKARPARFANAIAEIVRFTSRVGAETHLVEQGRAAAAHARGQ